MLVSEQISCNKSIQTNTTLHDLKAEMDKVTSQTDHYCPDRHHSVSGYLTPKTFIPKRPNSAVSRQQLIGTSFLRCISAKTPRHSAPRRGFPTCPALFWSFERRLSSWAVFCRIDATSKTSSGRVLLQWPLHSSGSWWVWRADRSGIFSHNLSVFRCTILRGDKFWFHGILSVQKNRHPQALRAGFGVFAG